MKFADCDPKSQLFIYEDEDDRKIWHIATGELEKYVDQHVDEVENVRVPVTKAQVQYYLHNRGIEDHRLLRLMMSLEHAVKPILYIKWEDAKDRHTLVDGHHRYVIHGAANSPWILAYLVPRKVWERFVIEDAPDHRARPGFDFMRDIVRKDSKL